MEPEVLIIDDGNELPLMSLQAIHRCRFVQASRLFEETAVNEAVAVIPAKDHSQAWVWANKVRTLKPGLPILFVSDQREPEMDLLRVQGFGPVKILHAYADDSDELLRDVQALMHPEYPVANKHIAVVLPVYNEAERFENVRNFVKKLRNKLGASYPDLTIFFVNDGSKDVTQDLVDQVIADQHAESQTIGAHSAVAAHKLAYNSRKAGTYIQGIKSIRADIIVFADADDSFDVDDMAAMINILQDGYWDMVIGTKDATAENRSAVRKTMSFVKRVLTRPLLPAGVIDSQTGLKALSGTSACHILPFLHETTGLAIDLEMVHIARRLNFRVLQIPVQCIDREGSHVDPIKDGIKFLKSIVTIWSTNRNVGLRALGYPKPTGGSNA